MNVKLRVLSAGAIFFLGIGLQAQKKASDTTTKTTSIEEVVVLGTYGIKESQEQKVGSYSVVSSKTLEKPNALSVDMAIAGQVSGTVINANSGQPGSNAKVLIRGISSLTGDNQPLYIVDGVPVLVGDQAGVATTSNALSMIDPSDIEEVRVLKDGATTSIYGSRGAAGVIIINTKSGRGGKGKLTLNAEYGLGSPAYEKFEFLNAAQEVDVLTKGYIAKGAPAETAASNVKSLLAWDGVTDTDWQKATRRSAAGVSKYNLNYSFGNEKIKGYASVGNTEQEGIIKDALYRRINALVKINAKVNDRINLTFSNMISRATQWGPLDYGYFANPILSARFTPPTNPVYNEDGSYNLEMFTSTGTNFNPVAIQNVNIRKSVFTKILSSAAIEYNIAKKLRFTSNLGIDHNAYDESEYRNPDFGDGNNFNAGIVGLAIQSNYTYTTLNWANFMHYDLKVWDDHSFNFSAGTEATIKWNKYPYQASTGFASNHYDQNNVSWGTTPFVTQSYETSSHLIGYIGRLSYGFKDLFNVMGSYRRDGYSHFGDNSKHGNFFAYGANINLHNVGNLGSTFDNLQLRANYGEVGNIGSIDYLYKPTLTRSNYIAQNGEFGFVIGSPGNPNLGWEKSAKTNIGIDLGILDRRLNASFDIYRNKITEQLSDQVPNVPSTGFANLTGNALESESKGFETSLSLMLLKAIILVGT